MVYQTFLFISKYYLLYPNIIDVDIGIGIVYYVTVTSVCLPTMIILEWSKLDYSPVLKYSKMPQLTEAS